jgi:hypothetical protein
VSANLNPQTKISNWLVQFLSIGKKGENIPAT